MNNYYKLRIDGYNEERVINVGKKSIVIKIKIKKVLILSWI